MEGEKGVVEMLKFYAVGIKISLFHFKSEK